MGLPEFLRLKRSNVEQNIIWLLKHLLEELRNIQTLRQQHVLYGHTHPNPGYENMQSVNKGVRLG